VHSRRIAWGERRRVLRAAALLSAWAIGLIGSLLSAGPAVAQCQQTGTTVTCTGTGNGFQAGGGINGLTVNVLPGAVATNPGNIVIGVNDANTVSNAGTLNGGDDGVGINAGSGNTITNQATGRITVGNSVSFGAAGVVMVDNNVFTNLGIIEVGSLVGCGCAFPPGGIFGGDNNTITNAAGAKITGGDTAFGIMVNNFSNVLNAGAITMGQNGLGISAGDHNTITNAAGGTITIGDALANQAIGIAVNNFNSVTNSGAITLGSTSFGDIFGIAAINRNNIVNNGTITLGSSDPSNFGTVAGIFVFDHNTIVNNGLVRAGNFGFGINTGDNNQVTNNGQIIVGAGMLSGGTPINAAVQLGSNNLFINNGLVRAGANAASIASCGFCTFGNQVINNGTVDGQIDLEGFGHSFTNNGLITITDPGTPVGAVHIIAGDFTQTATGALALRVTPNTAPFTYDSLQALTATLGGTLKAVVQPGLYQATQTYVGVLQFCGCSTGTFDSVVSTSAFLSASATYNPGSVDLTLTRIPFGAVPGETLNQQRVGNYLESLYSPGLTGLAAIFYGNLLAAGSVGVLDNLSGEGTVAAQQTAFNAGSMFNKTMLDQLLAWLGGGGGGLDPSGAVMHYAPSEKPSRPEYQAFAAIDAYRSRPWRAWVTAFGGLQSLGGDPVIGSAGSSQRTFGASGGIDYLVGRDLLLGFAAAGSSSSFSVPGRATTGTLEGAHLGLYGAYRWGAAYVAGTLSYSHFDNTTTRSIAGIGPFEVANGAFGSNQFGGRLQAGYRLAFEPFAVTPFAAVQYLTLRQSAYAENSFALGGMPGILGLALPAHSVTSLPTFLGVQLDTRFALGPVTTVNPFTRVAWVHEFMPDRNISAALGILPTGSFIVDGPRAVPDAARIESGANIQVARNVVFFGSFVGEYAAHSSSSAGNGGLRVTW
jgi:uncharacterized protein with beta-barrel porin domain